jgi:hypothetical protein
VRGCYDCRRMIQLHLRARILPAIVTALGVATVGVGLLTYPFPPDANGGMPGTSASPSAIASAGASTDPNASAGASATPGAGGHVASRVAIPALSVDLPVIAPPDSESHFPYCNVAEYMLTFGQPGDDKATFIYAHARAGMFLPLLTQSQTRNGAGMMGMIVEVYTNDYRLYLYEITEVHRRQSSLEVAYNAPAQSLILQTSEGPKKGEPGYTGTVLILVAKPLSSSPANPEVSVPVPHPVACS